MADAHGAVNARDRLAFLLALVPYLIDHERVAVATVAEHFRMPAERIREAVRLIAVSGIPGETAQYQHGDLFDIAWDDFEDNDQIVLTHLVAIDDTPRFSGREAAALIAGLQYLSALPESADRTAMATLADKLSRGASAHPSALAVEGSEPDEILALLRGAITRGVQVEFDYSAASGTHGRRRVDPLRIESMDADWYLRGWCHLRDGLRTFRLDRIRALTVTDTALTHPALTDSARTDTGLTDQGAVLPDSLFERSESDTTVVLEVLSSALPLLADYVTTAPKPVSADRSRVTISVAHFHSLKRLVAGMSSVVTVIEPGDARRTVAEWAAAGAARYEARN
ncbi:WYL domain-containing protein [Parafrigoribacterium mesophilum]|uniref:helix-turn-helix transcriptional regulator n=1 Tax=Parafrigoribacterium mesophilum TaxID=433646 RepID=UPI0031FD020E